MLLLPTLLLVVYILSHYLFDDLKHALNMLSFGLGIAVLFNDWDNTFTTDATVKLVAILTFIFYIMLVVYITIKEPVRRIN